MGVIQWLEQRRIPIDSIAGTSVGAPAGALHATGRNGREIELFVRELDRSAAFTPSAPFRHFAFRRKEDRRDFPSATAFGLRGGLTLPPGLSAGHGAEPAVRRFAAAASGNAWRAGASPLPRFSGSAGLPGQTAFGVAYPGGGMGDRGDRRLFFRLGRVF